MKLSDTFRRPFKMFYMGVYGLAIFAISFATLNSLYVTAISLLDVNIYTSQGNINYDYSNPYYFLGLSLLIGVIATYFLEKKKWLTKSAKFVILLFLPYYLLVAGSTFYQMKSLEHTPQRMKILKTLYGAKVEPCDVLKIGDPISRVKELYGSPAINSDPFFKTKSDKEIFIILYQLPFQAPFFSIHFEPNTKTIREIECFNGFWKKGKLAKPDTVYDYIEE